MGGSPALVWFLILQVVTVRLYLHRGQIPYSFLGASLAQGEEKGQNQSKVPAEWLSLGSLCGRGSSGPCHQYATEPSQLLSACEQGVQFLVSQGSHVTTQLVPRLPREPCIEVTVLRSLRWKTANVHCEASAVGQRGSPRRKPSPRRRQSSEYTPWSQNSRSRDHLQVHKGSQKGKGKGRSMRQGKGQQAFQSELPDPPAAVELKAPRVSAPESAPSNSSALLGALAASRADLPRSVIALLDAELESEHRTQTKALHRLVSQQSNARQELTAVRRARAQYAAEWLAYLEQLCGTLDQQVTAKQKALSEFEDVGEAARSSNRGDCWCNQEGANTQKPSTWRRTRPTRPSRMSVPRSSLWSQRRQLP